MKVYLAIPYSFNPDLSHKIANKVAAKFMELGYVVFSPISHSHFIADHLPPHLKTDSDWWMKQDLPLVDWADKLVVVVLPNDGILKIQQSKGVQMEIERAKASNKPIEYYLYEHD